MLFDGAQDSRGNPVSNEGADRLAQFMTYPFVAIETVSREGFNFFPAKRRTPVEPPPSYQPGSSGSQESIPYIFLVLSNEIEARAYDAEELRSRFIYDQGGDERVKVVKRREIGNYQSALMIAATRGGSKRSTRGKQQSTINQFASENVDCTHGSSRSKRKKKDSDDEWEIPSHVLESTTSVHATRRSTRNSAKKSRDGGFIDLQDSDSDDEDLSGYVDEFPTVRPGDDRMSEVLLQYPVEADAQDPVPISIGDLKRLKPGEFLNDNLINFYLKYTVSERIRSGASQAGTRVYKPLQGGVHIFNTHFYTKLTEDDRSLNDSEG